MECELQHGDLREIHVFINIANVLGQMFANSGELAAVDTNHTKMINLRISGQNQGTTPWRASTFPSLRKSNNVRPTTYI